MPYQVVFYVVSIDIHRMWFQVESRNIYVVSRNIPFVVSSSTLCGIKKYPFVCIIFKYFLYICTTIQCWLKLLKYWNFECVVLPSPTSYMPLRSLSLLFIFSPSSFLLLSFFLSFLVIFLLSFSVHLRTLHICFLDPRFAFFISHQVEEGYKSNSNLL